MVSATLPRWAALHTPVQRWATALPWPVQAGWPGALAVLAGLAALVLALWLTPRWQTQAQRAEAVQRQAHAAWVQQRALAQTHHQAHTDAQRQAEVASTPHLPQPDDTPAPVADLLEQALRHGVRVDRLSQAPATGASPAGAATSPVGAAANLPAPGPMSPLAGGAPRASAPGPAGASEAVARSGLQLQASGTVQALRAWASAALQQDRALSLDSLRWRRAPAGDGTLNAELQWSLWHSAAPAALASADSTGLPGTAPNDRAAKAGPARP